MNRKDVDIVPGLDSREDKNVDADEDVKINHGKWNEKWVEHV